MPSSVRSSFRIPAASMSSGYGRLVASIARRLYGGTLPDVVPVTFHHRPLMWATFRHESRIAKWRTLNRQLSSLAVMATAAEIGCSWCLDFGYYLAHNEGLDEHKVREVPRWRDSLVFTELEREVMTYAVAMTGTPPTVTDAQTASLIAQLGEKAMVELTMMVAVENQRSRFNAAAGLVSQGFSDVCELPLAEQKR